MYRITRETLTKTPPWGSLAARGSHLLAWWAAVLMACLVAPAMGQPSVTDLLGPLQLSSYASRMRPPPFQGDTATGQTVSQAELHGRVVLLNFWASWCAECRPEMPLFETLHRDFEAQGLIVIGVNFREEVRVIQRYAKMLGLTFPLLLDPQGEITASYGVIGLPTTFLFGRDGRPVALAVGPRAWGSAAARALIQALLAEPVTPKDVRSTSDLPPLPRRRSADR